MRVSVIIACYNKEKFVAECLNSLAKQTLKEIEIIVIDDASTDASLQILRQAQARDGRIILESLPENKGANHCRNLGLMRARSPFVVFLDADDMLAPHCLVQRHEKMVAGETGFAVFPLQTFRQHIGDSRSMWIPSKKDALKKFLRHDLPWQTMQPIWRTTFLRQIGGFDTAFERMQDVELHTRALLAPGVKFATFGGRPDCYFRIDESRKNFDAFTILQKWARSADRYCRKFEPLVPAGLRQQLFGTLFQLYLQIVHHYKSGHLTRSQFGSLEKQVMDSLPVLKPGASKRSIFLLARWYNLRVPRIPGTNRLLKALLT